MNFEGEIDQLITEIFEKLEGINAQQEQEAIDAVFSKQSASINTIQKTDIINQNEKDHLIEASQFREEGLSFLRNEKIKLGVFKLEQSKEIFKRNEFSKQGALLFNTFQYSAESFLKLKEKKYKVAEELMYNSLMAHKNLFDDFGLDFAFRRIHLAGNIAKIMSYSDRREESFILATKLLSYTMCINQSWPLNYCDIQDPDEFTIPNKFQLADQLISIIYKLLNKLNSKFVIENLSSIINEFEEQENKEAEVIYYWLNAITSQLKQNKLSFLTNSNLFLAKYNQSQGWALLYILNNLKLFVK